MRAQITIVALGPSEEALALRAVLETMGYPIRLLRAEDADGLAKSLRIAALDDVVILSAQANEHGFTLGEQNVASILPSEAFSTVQFEANAVLISTAGAARESGFVAAMFEAGGHLVAPNGMPDRQVIVPWVAACLLGADRGADLADAVHGANALVSQQNWFSYA